MFLPIATNY